MANLTALNELTVRLLGSTQVITSVFSVVKELIENALDADATTVDVRLENFGLDKVEVRDNGTGIPSKNVPFVAKRYHTSKISSFNDIQKLETYGFRGEALGSLCTVSTLSITTKTKEDEVSLTYVINNQGQITSSHPSHLSQGTTITVTGLFKNLPVRRQFYNTNKKKKEELKKIEDLIVAFSVILPKVRFTLTHDKEKVVQKNGVPDCRTALLGIMGKNVLNNLVHKSVELEDPKVMMDIFLPNPAGDSMVTSRSDNSRCICAVNNRPVIITYIAKLIKQHYTSYHKSDHHRYPVYFLSITVATDQLDVNVDPNKTIVLLHHKNEILKVLTTVLEEIYGSISAQGGEKVSHDESISDSQKGDNSSDDSLIIPQVTTKHSNIPAFKITTETSPESEPFTVDNLIIDQNLIDNHSSKTHDLTEIAENGLEMENVFSLSQLGKPVFQIIEDSLDDLINENMENHTEHDTSNEKHTTEHNTSNDKHTTEHDFKSPLNEKDTDKYLHRKCDENTENNTCYQNNPRVSQVYSDIVSTWKDTQVPHETTGTDSTNEKTDDIFKSTNQNAVCSSISSCVNSVIANDETSTESLKQNDKEDKCQDRAPPSGDLWSKGQSLNKDGKTIQPVTLLPGKRLLSPVDNEEPLPKKRHLIPQDEGQLRLSDIVCSQPVKHPHTAFTTYSKEHRDKVVSENPLADHDEITSIMETSWQSLPDEDKERYFVKTSPVTPNFSRLKNGNTDCEKKKKKIERRSKLDISKSSQSWTNIRDKLLKQNVSSASQKQKNISFNLHNMRTMFSQKLFDSQSQESSHIKLIGPLKSSGVWVCCHGNCIKILNPHRVQETVLYHNLLANHIVDSEKLDQPVVLTESYLGNSLWTTLKSLAEKVSGTGTYNVLHDKRFTGNGIEITFHKEETEFSAKVTGLTRYIPVYGLPDVKEVLHLISSTRAATLSETRPLKILNYLQGEAVRMARKLPRQQSKDDMIDLLIQMETVLPWKCEICLHNKSFYHNLHTLDDVPLSQSQT